MTPLSTLEALERLHESRQQASLILDEAYSKHLPGWKCNECQKVFDRATNILTEALLDSTLALISDSRELALAKLQIAAQEDQISALVLEKQRLVHEISMLTNPF